MFYSQLRLKLNAVVLFTALVSRGGAIAGNAPNDVTIKGTIAVDYRSEVSSFALKIGEKHLYYSVGGMTKPVVGYYETVTDLAGVEVTKHQQIVGQGTVADEELLTEGSLSIFPRKRFLNDVTIAGVKLEGKFIQGYVNDGLFIDDLEVDGKDSKGLLDYNGFLGYYRAKRGLRFGDTKIVSSLPASNILSNYDNYNNQHRNTFTMIFGDLKIEGLAYYTDQIESSTDSEGNTTTTTVATSCRHDLKVTHKDGSPVKLAPNGQAPTPDDMLIRKFIAMWVLFSFDLHR